MPSPLSGGKTVARSKAAAYSALAVSVVQLARSVEALEYWWTDETDHRVAYGVVKGSPEWRALVQACSYRKAQILSGVPAF
jgi:hypothetical protein